MTGHGEKGWGGHFDPHLAATAAACLSGFVDGAVLRLHRIVFEILRNSAVLVWASSGWTVRGTALRGDAAERLDQTKNTA